MISHWILSDIKSSQVSRTFLSFQTDVANAVDWRVPNCRLDFKSSSPFDQTYGNCSECYNYNWYRCHFHVS